MEGVRLFKYSASMTPVDNLWITLAKKYTFEYNEDAARFRSPSCAVREVAL